MVEARERLDGLAATSLDALQDYLAGRRAYRRGDYFAAMDLYESAFRRDSSFAQAGFGLVATNPLTSMANTPRIRRALEKLDFLVVQDAYADVETNQYAHLFLPAALWSEKEGCFTNTERRVSHVARIAEPPGEAKPDHWIFSELAKRMMNGSQISFPETTSEIFDEMRQLSRGRPLDITGMSHERISSLSI